MTTKMTKQWRYWLAMRILRYGGFVCLHRCRLVSLVVYKLRPTWHVSSRLHWCRLATQFVSKLCPTSRVSGRLHWCRCRWKILLPFIIVGVHRNHIATSILLECRSIDATCHTCVAVLTLN